MDFTLQYLYRHLAVCLDIQLEPLDGTFSRLESSFSSFFMRY